MKNYFKQIVAVALMLAMTVIPTFAAAQPALSATPDFSSALDGYFAVRGETLVSPARRTSTLSTSFSALETTRAQNFAAADDNIEVVDATANYVVVNSEVNGNTAVLDVYEWSWLEYYADDTVTSTNTMGFGTEHRITLNKVNGEWVMASDKYDESDITGVSTLAPSEELVLNYDRALLNEVYAATVGAEQLKEQSSVGNEYVVESQTRGTSNINTSIASDYNPYDAISYANMWVVRGYASDDEMMIDSYYNPAYVKYPADCINYVSQCLRAGGLEFINGDRDAGSDDEWWYDSTQSGLYAVSPNPWRHTYYFDYLWTNYNSGEFMPVEATEATVFPGNPVYYVRSESKGGHGAICVGYNAAGNTIYNAHNRDVYHVTMNFIGSSSYTLKTIQFADASTYNTPNVAYDYGVVQQTGTYGCYFPNGAGTYFKFTVNSAGTYSMYSEKYITEPELDTYAYLYKESETVQAYVDENNDGVAELVNRTLYMLQISENNNYTSVSFKISMYLTPGTYYFLVRPADYTSSGYAYIKVKPGT